MDSRERPDKAGEETKEHGQGWVASRYTRYESLRLMVLTRARQAALLTIPPLVPPQNNTIATKYPTPYQALGARGVNNLAAKLLLALFPVGEPFFRLTVDEMLLAKLTGDTKQKTKLDKLFAAIERTAMRHVETSAVRIKVFEAIKQLLVAGNVLLLFTKDGDLRVFRLDRFVVKRDPMGNVLEIITKEDLSPLAIPEDIRRSCLVSADDDNPEDVIPLYTRLTREEDGTFTTEQELNGYPVPDSFGTYPADECPWMALRWASVENEDYGRSFCEEYLGDLQALEGLSKAILESAAAASKVLFLVKPNASTSKRKIAEAPNGAMLDGNIDDVGVLQLEKYADFRVAFEQVQELTKRLSFAFLLNTSVQRTGERVTAQEIRYVAGELEDALGGNYSVLSQELQLPYIKALLRFMTRKGSIPELPKGVVSPAVITGLDAIGRGHDLNKLDLFMQHVAQTPQQEVQRRISWGDYYERVGVAAGLDIEGLVRSDDEIQAEMQQQMTHQAGLAVAPQVARGVMDMASQAASPQPQPQETP